MKTREFAIGILLITMSLSIYAQDYFIVKKDTTFCKNLSYNTTSQGYLRSMKYTDMDGQEVSLKGRDKVPDVLTFFIDGVSIDKTPLVANKPDSYIRYTQRAVDGVLKVYISDPGQTGMQYTPGAAGGDWSTGGPSGTYRFFLKMPNGTYIKVNSPKNMKEKIKPFLLKCEEFKKQYKGDFSTMEKPFIEMIELYNSLCN
ncbi:MAG: hypothetical protein WCM76_16565 [Bacteroidota bacterium]